MEVACVVEGAYVVHVAAMLDSLLAHTDPRTVHVHYVHGPGERGRRTARLERWLTGRGARVTFHLVEDERCAGLPTVGFTGKATWYRIFLPELLPDAPRVLFLDADVIVRADLRPLWETDLQGHALGAVTNVFEPEYLHRAGELGLADPREYFNAGVLLLDLDALRAEDAARRLHAYAVEHADEVLWRDQDTLNAVLAGRRLALHPRWNAMNILRFTEWAEPVYGAAETQEALRRPAIRHFEGPADNKPWHAGCVRDDRALYASHRRNTPWPRVRYEGPPRVRARRVVVAALGRLRG